MLMQLRGAGRARNNSSSTFFLNNTDYTFNLVQLQYGLIVLISSISNKAHLKAASEGNGKAWSLAALHNFILKTNIQK